VGDRYHWTDDDLMMPNQGAPTPPPAWSLTIPAPQPQGNNPPCHPITIRGAVTDPDAAGHQWAMLELDDGTVTARIRLPWQNADAVGMAIAQILAQIKAAVAAASGPQLIVPPAGTSLPDLNIRKNGHRP
jgi:hypothetical protein